MPRFVVVLLLASGLWLSASGAEAQDQQVLFPGQIGAELRASIKAAYRPSSLTGDNDDLYSVVDRTTVDGVDGVIGVYTGLFVEFDCQPSCDPSQDVFNNNAGINQEHTFPRAELNGSSSHISESDLHNLFPTRVSVNADRGNFPFREIPDAQTTRWYRGSTATSTAPPEAERDEWSELRSGQSFEPREVHEGNVARAMFYMATVWDDVADLAWFSPQQEDLYAWHLADPVDQAEVDRSDRVAAFQRTASGAPAPNPFVVDSTLIRRAFFTVVANETAPEASGVTLALAGPNPFGAQTRVRVVARGVVRVSIIDALGREAKHLYEGPLAGDEATLTVSGDGLAPGLYLVRVVSETGTVTRRLVRTR
ncbi:endonuclease [Rubricoccus marinus]|uniref:Secretion system C-terminal sorting domain-containing protein n=1 Tax=Rubricoccus marinus TaxID=716817 RepID=A0A259U308_9BACT|nr:endonuclease [Rubricoccus marinus]OZC04184.1 hypothetical protein BSZ36_15055 [Rubricoccus marinus]